MHMATVQDVCWHVGRHGRAPWLGGVSGDVTLNTGIPGTIISAVANLEQIPPVDRLVEKRLTVLVHVFNGASRPPIAFAWMAMTAG